MSFESRKKPESVFVFVSMSHYKKKARQGKMLGESVPREISLRAGITSQELGVFDSRSQPAQKYSKNAKRCTGSIFHVGSR